MTRVCLLLLLVPVCSLPAQETGALQKLRAEAAARPADAIALSRLAAALDAASAGGEADRYHRKAVSLAPASVDILNNYATHLWLAGQQERALEVYRRVVALDAGQVNANVMLAQAALKKDNGAEALGYVDRLPDSFAQKALLRAEAAYSAGMALAGAMQYARAEASFETALKADPESLKAMLALGASASAAGDYVRARDVLTAARLREPRNTDVLYRLAAVEMSSGHPDAAAQSLATAANIDPKRADVQKLLAVAMSEMNAWDDAAAAWDRYLKLVPGDEAAQRERAYTAVVRGDSSTGVAGLEKYVSRHPGDVVGQYELGQAAKSIEHLNRAVALDPNYVPARAARGSLLYQEGNAEAALKDLEAAVALRPDDAANLDRLGQVYQSLDRTGDAVRILRKAAQLAPADAKTQLHLGRALADAGEMQESKAAMDRFRELGNERRPGIPRGFVDYLAMSPAERLVSYRARVEKTVRDHPDDIQAQLAYLKLKLEQHRMQDSAQAFERLSTLKPDAVTMAEAGRALLSAEQYALARQALMRARDVDLELAIANFHLGNGSAASINEAIRKLAEERRPEVHLTAAAFLLRNDRPREALALLENAAKRLPDNRDVLLRLAAANEASGKWADAEYQLIHIESRWPEWYPVWEEHAAMLQRHNRTNDAKKALETASALGAP